MLAVKGHLERGRLKLDEPTSLPEGEVIELVPVYEVLARGGDMLDDEERAALHKSIEEGVEDNEKGNTVDAFEFLATLRSERANQDRQASAGAGRTACGKRDNWYWGSPWGRAKP
jgi:hypothetical protein